VWFWWAHGYEAAFEHISKAYNILVALRGDQERKTLKQPSIDGVGAVISREVRGGGGDEFRRARGGEEKVLLHIGEHLLPN
jgi:hypothetical protein